MASAVWVLPLLVAAATAIICPTNICKNVSCPNLDSCEGGYLKASGSFCGCCDVCVSYIDEGKPCWDHVMLGMPLMHECRPGLYCSTKSHTCKKMNNIQQCDSDRKEVLDKMNELGVPIPTCDEDGTYSAVQCLEAVCTCATKAGHQLKYQFSVSEAKNSACECAREEYSLKGRLGKRVFCDELGNYKGLQCLGSMCYCVEPKHGQKVGNAVHRKDADQLNC